MWENLLFFVRLFIAFDLHLKIGTSFLLSNICLIFDNLTFLSIHLIGVLIMDTDWVESAVWIVVIGSFQPILRICVDWHSRACPSLLDLSLFIRRYGGFTFPVLRDNSLGIPLWINRVWLFFVVLQQVTHVLVLGLSNLAGFAQVMSPRSIANTPGSWPVSNLLQHLILSLALIFFVLQLDGVAMRRKLRVMLTEKYTIIQILWRHIVIQDSIGSSVLTRLTSLLLCIFLLYLFLTWHNHNCWARLASLRHLRFIQELSHHRRWHFMLHAFVTSIHWVLMLQISG